MKKEQNNKGLTLVELVVCIVIFGIILAAICGFMIAGTTSYKSINDRLTAETKLQLAANQIAEQLIDCDQSAVFEGIDDDCSLYVVNDAGSMTGTLHNYIVHVYRWVDKNNGGSIFYGTPRNLLKEGVASVSNTKSGCYTPSRTTMNLLSGFLVPNDIVSLVVSDIKSFDVAFYTQNGTKRLIPPTGDGANKNDQSVPMYTAELTMQMYYGNGTGSERSFVSVTKVISLRNHPGMLYNRRD